MFDRFRNRYPQGSLVTELSAIDHGKYIVRCLVQVEGTTLATGLAAAETVELAEDRARSRALAILGIDATTTTEEKKTPVATSDVSLHSTAPVASTLPPQSWEQPQTSQFSEAAETNNAVHFSSFEPKSEKSVDRTPSQPAVADEITYTNHFSSAEVEIPQEEEVETSHWMAQNNSKSQANDGLDVAVAPPPPETDTIPTPAPSDPIDFSDIIARTNVELKRLGWTNQQGREYLLQTYGKRSRQLLTDAELLDFLHHLEKL